VLGRVGFVNIWVSVNGVNVVGIVGRNISCDGVVTVIVITAIIADDNGIGIGEFLWWIPSSVTGGEGSGSIVG